MKRKPHPTTTARREAERRTMVRRVRAKVRDGTYENALKLSVALDRLIERLRS